MYIYIFITFCVFALIQIDLPMENQILNQWTEYTLVQFLGETSHHFWPGLSGCALLSFALWWIFGAHARDLTFAGTHRLSRWTRGNSTKHHIPADAKNWHFHSNSYMSRVAKVYIYVFVNIFIYYISIYIHTYRWIEIEFNEWQKRSTVHFIYRLVPGQSLIGVDRYLFLKSVFSFLSFSFLDNKKNTFFFGIPVPMAIDGSTEIVGWNLRLGPWDDNPPIHWRPFQMNHHCHHRA